VAPAELEDVIHKHPSVQDVAVIGIPDERAGELPRAYIVCKPNTNADAEAIQKFVAGEDILVYFVSTQNTSFLHDGNTKYMFPFSLMFV